MKPFVRWVGGKRRLLETIGSIALGGLQRGDPSLHSYAEPFVGGGAMFFHYGRFASKSLIADVNLPLAHTYAMVKLFPEQLMQAMDDFSVWEYPVLKHALNNYASLSSSYDDRGCGPQLCRAALFLILNHLCFNGLYRTNKRGEFNTPIGKTGSTAKGTNKPRRMASFPYDLILPAHSALQHTVVKGGSFLETMVNFEIVPGHTLVFCDPPYLGEFSRYDPSGFSKAHHVELACSAAEWRDRGALVIVCGSDNAASHQIYGQPTKVIELKRTVGASKRGNAREALYVFYP